MRRTASFFEISFSATMSTAMRTAAWPVRFPLRVCRMGKVCVCGASGIQIDYQKRTLSANGTTLAQGDYISIDGTAGEVFAGEVTTAPSEIIQVLVDRSLDGKKSLTYREYAKLMTWADEFRKLGIRTNADTPQQVTNAVAFGAEGIGLCRTEHR